MIYFVFYWNCRKIKVKGIEGSSWINLAEKYLIPIDFFQQLKYPRSPPLYVLDSETLICFSIALTAMTLDLIVNSGVDVDTSWKE